MKARALLVLLAATGSLYAQAAAEAALGASRAVTSTAPAAQQAGKSIAGAFENISKSLEKSTASQPAASSVSVAPKASKKTTRTRTAEAAAPAVAATSTPKPAAVYEDPSGIQPGMDAEELARRFGPPALKLTTAAGEVLSYNGKEGALDVTMKGAKVGTVRKADGSK